MKPATSAVVALTALNLLNYLDRFVVAGMVEPLKKANGAVSAVERVCSYLTCTLVSNRQQTCQLCRVSH